MGISTTKRPGSLIVPAFRPACDPVVLRDHQAVEGFFTSFLDPDGGAKFGKRRINGDGAHRVIT